MKYPWAIAIIALLVFTAGLYPEKPFREWLEINDVVPANFIAGTTVRLVLIAIGWMAVRKLALSQFAGLNRSVAWTSLLPVGIVVMLAGFSIFGNLPNYRAVPISTLFLFITYVFSVGAVEEICFRGIIFPQFVRTFQSQKNALLYAALASSFCFAALHFINILSQPDNLSGILSQMFFALSIGVFFCGVMVRTGNIIIPIFLHALINFSFGSGELNPDLIAEASSPEPEGPNWNSIIPTTIFFGLILLAGIRLIMQSDQAAMLDRIRGDATD